MAARVRAAVLGAGVMLALASCHRWVPIDQMPASGDRTVHMVLTEEGSAAVMPLLGNGVVEAEGQLLSLLPDTIRVSLREIRTRDGQSLFLQGTSVDIARVNVAEARGRRLDRRRSALAGVVALVAAGAVVGVVRAGGGGGGDLPGGGPTPALRSP